MNELGLPSVVVPITKMDKMVNVEVEGYKGMSELDMNMETQDDCKTSLVSVLRIDDPEIYDGASVSLQLIGGGFRRRSCQLSRSGSRSS